MLADMIVWIGDKIGRISQKGGAPWRINHAPERCDVLARYAMDGRRAAIIHTLVQSARMNDLNPHTDLAGTVDAMARAWARAHRTGIKSSCGVSFVAER